MATLTTATTDNTIPLSLQIIEATKKSTSSSSFVLVLLIALIYSFFICSWLLANSLVSTFLPEIASDQIEVVRRARSPATRLFLEKLVGDVFTSIDILTTTF